MSRSERLLALLQNLRRRKYAVSGRVLADELAVSLRTLYRDIAALQAQGAPIEGEAGVGYILRPGYILPPLMFTPEEIEAMLLGTRWVIERGDVQLVEAARDVLAKIGAVLPPALKRDLETGTLLIPTEPRLAFENEFVVGIRNAIREETKISISYRDLQDRTTERVIWPFALAYYDQVMVVIAWCEMRGDFRHFRADRVAIWNVTGERYPRRRLVLLREWQEKNGIPLDKYEL